MNQLERLLTVDDVLERLALRDRATARRIMREAGAIDLGRGRLRVTRAALGAWEADRFVSAEQTAPTSAVANPRRRRARGRTAPLDLHGDWWNRYA